MDALRTASPAARPTAAFWPHLIALSGYLLLSALLTWPTVLDLTGHVFTSAGGAYAYPGHDDIVQNAWNLWWVRRALTTGANPFFTPLLFYPDGIQMYVQTVNVVSAVLTLPVQLLAGVTAAYNAGLLLAFTLTGYAAYLLARSLGAGRAAAWAAGALVTASPFHMMKLEVNHFNLVNMQWLGFVMLAFIGIGRGPLWRRVVLAALALVVVALSDWYWAFVAGLFVAAWAPLDLLRSARSGAVRVWGLVARYVLAGGLAALALSPILLAVAGLRGSLSPPGGSDGVRWQEWVRNYSADALGLLFPSLRQPLWTAQAEVLTEALLRDVYVVEGWYVAAGWVLMALAALGAWRHGRRHWPLLAAAVVAWLISLGPELRLAGINTGLPMPYALLAELPLVELARRPNLFAVICIFAAAVFAALALDDLAAWAGRRRAWVFAAAAALAALELLPPVRYGVSLAAPSVYQSLAARPGPILDVPVGNDIDSRTLLHQMAHGQPVVGGYVARPAPYPTLGFNPLVLALVGRRPLPERDIVPLDSAALLTMQCAYGFRHLILERPLLSTEELSVSVAALERLAAAPQMPLHEDERFAVYELPRPTGRCDPFLYLGDGWGPIERSGDQLWRWLGPSGELYVVNPGPAVVAATLSLSTEAFDPGGLGPVPVRLTLDGAPLAEFRVGRAARRYLLPLQPPPGEHLLLLEAQARRADGGRALSLSVAELRLRPAP